MKNLQHSNSKIITGIMLLFVVMMITTSCNKSSYNSMTGMGGNNGGGGSGGPGPNEVFIQGMAFTPASLSVAAGTTVTWTNKDAIGHTVTSTTNLFGSATLGTNGTFSYTFANAGTYAYYCSIHPGMTGSVTVK